MTFHNNGPQDGEKVDNTDHLSRMQTAQSVNMSMEMFEKLYLNPANKVSGDLRRTFANPTPLPLLGFLIAFSPLVIALMGWRGAGGGGAATIGVMYFFGGLLQIIGSVLEWIIGNTFPYIVFGAFGAFWLAFAATLTPYYNAEAAFTAGATTAAEKAAGIASFQASLAFFLLFMGLLVFFFLICSLRINIVFFIIFLTLDIAILVLTAAYWKASAGDIQSFEHLSVVAGGWGFVTAAFGWYLLLAQLLSSVEFPLDLPVGDLSNRIKKRTTRPNDLEKN